jgi:hypothetical protein
MICTMHDQCCRQGCVLYMCTHAVANVWWFYTVGIHTSATHQVPYLLDMGPLEEPLEISRASDFPTDKKVGGYVPPVEYTLHMGGGARSLNSSQDQVRLGQTWCLDMGATRRSSVNGLRLCLHTFEGFSFVQVNHLCTPCIN